MIPKREGWYFLGWAESADTSDPVYLPGDSFTKDADATLYAIWGQPDFVLPAALTSVGEEAFANCAFCFVALSEKTTEIQRGAFADCQNLKYIYIPEACTSINEEAFNGTSGLTILCETGSYAEYFASRWGFVTLLTA